jgi:hypothetical protein
LSYQRLHVTVVVVYSLFLLLTLCLLEHFDRDIDDYPMDLQQQKASGADEIDLKKDVAADSFETDPALDRRITRKLDFHILPWIFILWLLAFIDRSNIGT